MTDPKPNVCRIIAEQIYYSYPHFRTWFPEHKKEEIIRELTNAIRDHTVVPEMVSMLEVVEHELSQPLSGKTVLGSQIYKLLRKARGRKP